MKGPYFSILLVLSLTTCSRDNDWQGRVFKAGGVLTIENKGPGLWSESVNKKVSFENELSLGKESGEDYLMFHQNVDVSIDPALNVYVLDCGNNRLIKFDRNGKHIWSAGREGQGPGEFQRPLKVMVNRQNNVCVLDNNYFVHFFNGQGNYEKSVRVDDSVEDFQEISDGRVFARTSIPQQTGLAAAYYTSQFKLLGRFPVNYPYGPKISGGGNIGGALKYIPERIYMVLPDKYEIREYDLAGHLVRKITRDYEFEPPEVKRFQSGGFLIAAKTHLGPIFMEKKGFLINQILQIKGTSEQDMQLLFFLDFFDDEGKFLGSYRLPEWTRLLAIDPADKFYFLRFDPFPSVIRSALAIH